MYNEEAKMQESKRYENDCVKSERSMPMPPPGDRTNRLRQIMIEELTRGYMVRVGCATFAISTKAEMLEKLTEYINDPELTEQKWYTGELFEK